MTTEYMRNYQRKWIAQRRLEWVISQGHKCAKCGDTQGPFDIDHIDRATKTCRVNDLWSRSKEIRDAELAKCQLLCKPCHKAKTRDEMTLKNLEHGTSPMYRYRGCRCDECRAWNAARAARERAARKAKASCV